MWDQTISYKLCNQTDTSKPWTSLHHNCNMLNAQCQTIYTCTEAIKTIIDLICQPAVDLSCRLIMKGSRDQPFLWRRIWRDRIENQACDHDPDQEANKSLLPNDILKRVLERDPCGILSGVAFPQVRSSAHVDLLLNTLWSKTRWQKKQEQKRKNKIKTKTTWKAKREIKHRRMTNTYDVCNNIWICV